MSRKETVTIDDPEIRDGQKRWVAELRARLNHAIDLSADSRTIPADEDDDATAKAGSRFATFVKDTMAFQKAVSQQIELEEKLHGHSEQPVSGQPAASAKTAEELDEISDELDALAELIDSATGRAVARRQHEAEGPVETDPGGPAQRNKIQLE